MSQAIPLSDQLAWAARCVLAVEQGRSLTDAIARVPAGVRPGVQALAFHALRHWGQAQVLLKRLAERPPQPQVHALLGIALTLLLPTEARSNVQYAPHTVVDQAVQALAVLRQPRGAVGFVNACLRRFLREQSGLEAQAAEDMVARWNHPFWWVQRLRRDHPQHWQALLQANNQPAPMVLRVNRRKTTRAAYLGALQNAGMPAQPLGDDGVVLEQPHPVERLPGWHGGWVSVQDGAAQLAAPLLLGAAHLPARARVLDACAAPGGKTAHLLECADLDLLALDVDAQRCERIRANLDRLGLRAEVQTADAGQPGQWWDGRRFDAILLDAPCTASGIVRRHPDVRWLRRPDDIAQLAAQQQRLLEALWPTLQAGGHVLYCTCSVFKAEGDGQVQAFLARHPDAELRPSPGHLLPGAPGAADLNDNATHGLDGFFYALLRKRSHA
jgi:16S rRNA (cytosine967-C5)-methyltransferase